MNWHSQQYAKTPYQKFYIQKYPISPISPQLKNASNYQSTQQPHHLPINFYLNSKSSNCNNWLSISNVLYLLLICHLLINLVLLKLAIACHETWIFVISLLSHDHLSHFLSGLSPLVGNLPRLRKMVQLPQT